MDSTTITVPAYSWIYGCSAVSAAMIAAFYDRNGYSDMYTGPTNSGVMPLDSSSWPVWIDGSGHAYRENPMIASRNELDGRAANGSLDDYWVSSRSAVQDPYITNSWAPHSWGAAIGDYMKTSQSAYGNDDSSTTFYAFQSSATPLTCNDMVSYRIAKEDGTYGRKLFYEARGYEVGACYSQKTDNTVSGGFSFAQFKAEIDASRPVLLNLEGHSVVGIGYDDATTTVYIHDTWDYLTHTMTWGGSYAGMDLFSVSIVNIVTPPLSTSTTTTVLQIATTTTTTVLPDTDHDGVADAADNCPGTYNPLQHDADGDGAGDVCDPTPGCGGCGQPACENYFAADADADMDTIPSAVDNCPDACNFEQRDADGDGIGDVCDPTPGCGGCGQPACETQCTPLQH
jgi:hypothetical protein